MDFRHKRKESVCAMNTKKRKNFFRFFRRFSLNNEMRTHARIR